MTDRPKDELEELAERAADAAVERTTGRHRLPPEFAAMLREAEAGQRHERRSDVVAAEKTRWPTGMVIGGILIAFALGTTMTGFFTTLDRRITILETTLAIRLEDVMKRLDKMAVPRPPP